MIDSLRHVQVVGALARLAGNGAWSCILGGHPIDDPTDLADVDLLVGADVLRRSDDGSLVPCDLHPWYDDPGVLASGVLAQLRRALRHGQGSTPDAVDPDEIVAMGVASESVARILAEAIVPMLPVTSERFTEGSACFLDVGAGTGAIAERLCRTFPGTLAVGIDVAPEALAVAKERMTLASMGDLIELRLQSVVDLPDRDAFDLAWMPQIFLSPGDLELGLARVHRALRPECWLVMPVAASGPDDTALERAALVHDSVIRGGGPMSVETAGDLLEAAGFVDVRSMPGVQQALVMARKPSPSS